ncbi:MAG: hypothetical protein M4D80_33485 [Myxococcota bacterium]|nr:hypothetical protein [Myxococcota bacterium]
MSIVDELLDAIEDDPKDEASQLVIADYLQAAGDPRGDLIILDHAEKRGLLDGAEALEQILLLAAEYSFPRAEPDEPILPFTRRAPRGIPAYDLQHDGKRYALDWEEEREQYRFEIRGTYVWFLPLDLGAWWTEEQTRVIFTILSDVIRASAPFDELRFPYGTMPLPQYEGSPLRCYTLPTAFTIPRGILRNRYGLAARDYHRWHAIWQRLRAMQRR